MTSTASGHPLDNVIWQALTTAQADWSRGGALARRFRPEFAPFAGAPTPSGDALTALAADMDFGEVVALSDPADFDPGPLFDVTDRKNLVQMIGPATGEVREPQRFRALGRWKTGEYCRGRIQSSFARPLAGGSRGNCGGYPWRFSTRCVVC